jgi:hypothetical protein
MSIKGEKFKNLSENYIIVLDFMDDVGKTVGCGI